MSARLSFRTQMKLGAQMVLASQLLRASGAELEELVASALHDYPALELHSASSRWQAPASAGASGWDSQEALESIAYQPSLFEELLGQAGLLAPAGQAPLVERLLLNLDEHGYLAAPLEELALELDRPLAELESLLEVLHQLEPPGIGARNLQECLLIQMRHLEADGRGNPLARRLVADAWDDFCSQSWRRAARSLKVTPAEVQAAGDWIARSLCPYPLNQAPLGRQAAAAPVQPDLVILPCDQPGQPPHRVELPARQAFDLRIRRSFTGCLRDEALSHASQERAWIAQQVEQGRIFIASLEQRWSTLQRIGEEIVRIQGDFLKDGPACLKPLTRLQVAGRLGLSESTVSRAVSDKWALLPNRRLAPLSLFFDHSLPLKDQIQAVIAAENGRLSDQEIASRLHAQGVNVARRTVAKYRQQLRLPSSHSRLSS